MPSSMPFVFGSIAAGAVIISYGVKSARTAFANISSAAPQAGASPSSSTTGKAAPPSNSSERAFIAAALKTIGAPANPANVNSLSAWFKREEPGWPVPYAYNPLNIKGSAPHPYSYPSASAGIEALAHTLQGYPCILAALKSGKGLCGQCASEFSTWSGGGYDSPC